MNTRFSGGPKARTTAGISPDQVGAGDGRWDIGDGGPEKYLAPNFHILSPRPLYGRGGPNELVNISQKPTVLKTKAEAVGYSLQAAGKLIPQSFRHL